MDITLAEIGTHAAAFLLGGLAGAVGHYLGEKYTDRRREQEAETEGDRAFRRLTERMPDLFRAIRADLDRDASDLVREFFVLATPGVTLGGSSRARFRYNVSEFENLREKLDLLVDAGLILDITGDGAQTYRLREDLVERLRKESR